MTTRNKRGQGLTADPYGMTNKNKQRQKTTTNKKQATAETNSRFLRDDNKKTSDGKPDRLEIAVEEILYPVGVS
jgi:hypothetical protein